MILSVMHINKELSQFAVKEAGVPIGLRFTGADITAFLKGSGSQQYSDNRFSDISRGG